ncbi:hypothetical protein F53441_7617 [Fusarium austroafricanum]|uniref:Uncharacterized protein n=1 Tax=Fusarium austroafricanum TaxID=2364996 RepID=A0A8H4P5I9_9HYPO|nr:hypothetical protein F53441_7617 [Fusarium austroafricanum]
MKAVSILAPFFVLFSLGTALPEDDAGGVTEAKVAPLPSVCPSKGTTCTLYDLFDCKGQKLDGIHRPGIDNLAKFHFNDKTNSFRCS